MANIYDMSDTWNDGATTFTSIKMNVVDTASASGSVFNKTGSALLELQTNGDTKFWVGKNGGLWLKTGEAGGAGRSIAGIGSAGSEVWNINGAGTANLNGLTSALFVSTNRLVLQNQAEIYSGAADVIDQRRSTNAQTFNLYNTYTDASNYERGFMKWNSNVLEIGTEGLGSGATTPRTVTLTSGSNIYLQNGGFLRWGMVGTDPNFIALRNTGGLKFSSTSSFPGAPDAGLARSGTNQLKVTNGSTGTGELIFIVPTVDPGITGALWNNAGTLSISA